MTDAPDRLITALADRYRIDSEIGSGGMATVYLAQDLKHDRQVAVKVLKPELAAILGAERFLSEIKTTANLQHPHILPLFDSGEADGFLFYVMPYVEGESLREKLDREKQLSVEEAVGITKAVANALDYAHRHAVIHRDIKPANILLHDGQPMVADFGIALAVRAAGGARLTETGLSLGTPQYMSPEQASGDREVDGRTDIYSLGAVLYEMLAGEPPHAGPTVQAIIAKLLTDKPRPVTELRETVPGNVAASLHKALEKLPADRFSLAADLGRALSDQSFLGDAPAKAGASAGTHPLWNGLSRSLALISLALLAITVWAAMQLARREVLETYDVGLPESAPMSMISGYTALSVSPGGDFVVYRAATDTSLWYRSLRTGESRKIEGTEGVRASSVSPGGDVVAFFTPSEVKVVPVNGGSISTLAETADPLSIQWISDSRLFIGHADFTEMMWIDVQTGGVETREVQCSNPAWISDTQLLCGGGGFQEAQVLDLADGSRGYIRHSGFQDQESGPYLRGANFRLVEGSYLTYMSNSGNLNAVSVDLENLEAGPPVELVSRVRRQPYTGAGQFTFSEAGTLVYAEGVNGDVGDMVLWNGRGDPESLPFDPAMFLRFDLSQDGRQLAAVVEEVGGEELRVYDTENGQFHPWFRDAFIDGPCWMPGGETLIVGTTDRRNRTWAILMGSPFSTSPPDTLFSGSGANGYEIFSCHDLSQITGGSYGSEQHTVAIDLSTTPPVLDTIVEGGLFAVLAPDGRRLSYIPADRGGIVVAPYPALNFEYNVGRNRSEPRWLSSTELVFWEAGGKFYRASMGDPEQTRPGTEVLWHFDPRFSDTPGSSYKLTAEGGLIYVQEPEQSPATYLRVIPNWVEKMKRAVDEASG